MIYKKRVTLVSKSFPCYPKIKILNLNSLMIELVYLNRSPQSQYKDTKKSCITKFIFKFLFVPKVGLEPTRLSPLVPKTSVSTIPPPGHINHPIQAFYSLLRGIVSNLARLTAIWVPEVVICSPSRTRTYDLRFRKPLLYPSEL